MKGNWDTIYKYSLPLLASEFSIDMPKGSKILSLQLQDEWPTIWALVNHSVGLVTRKFIIVGTGFSLGLNWKVLDYVGTYQKDGFVWHVFVKQE